MRDRDNSSLTYVRVSCARSGQDSTPVGAAVPDPYDVARASRRSADASGDSQGTLAGHHHLEFEHSINAAMNRLRQTLGDSVDDPHYIETLARRGYRRIVSFEGMEV